MKLPRALGVTSDSRKVQSGWVFVAVQGTAQDGHQFLSEVEKIHPALMVGEKEFHPSTDIPYQQVSDSRAALAELAAEFYEQPSQSMLMVGVTGTSGKTTTSYLIEAILKAAGHRVGLIGTVSIRYGDKVYPSELTTPGAVELQKILSEMKKDGCTAVVMEVSSHALKQKRTACIAFDGMVFTNLSPEHLDFHPDMEDYFQSKAILFKDYAVFSQGCGKKPVAAVNQADSYGQRLLQELRANSALAKIEAFEEDAELQMTVEGIQGRLRGVQIQSSLTGGFNIQNISGAVTLALALGISAESISKGIQSIPVVPGRLERVENSEGIHIWVDYAHKADALEKVIATLQQVRDLNPQSRLITVFGCGGDRDRQKRPRMGKIAAQGSDWVIVTSDNPRTEDPAAIIQEILIGMSEYKNFQVEEDRRKAIFKAIQLAKPGDLILIAGKGHEDYQVLGKEKIHFDDREVAREGVAFLKE